MATHPEDFNGEFTPREVGFGAPARPIRTDRSQECSLPFTLANCNRSRVSGKTRPLLLRKLNYGYEISRLYRRADVKLSPSRDTDRDHRDVVGYNATTGQVSSITRYWSGGSQSFTYGYATGRDSVGSITNGSFRRTISREAYRNLEYDVETKWGNAVKAKYTYANNCQDYRAERQHDTPGWSRFSPHSKPIGFIGVYSRQGHSPALAAVGSVSNA